MTRWKREFSDWVEREGLRVALRPKHWKDWENAKILSRVADHQVRRGDFMATLTAQIADDLIHNGI